VPPGVRQQRWEASLMYFQGGASDTLGEKAGTLLNILQRSEQQPLSPYSDVTHCVSNAIAEKPCSITVFIRTHR
jgi:hypothetical protein